MTTTDKRAMAFDHVLSWCSRHTSRTEALIDLLADARHWCDGQRESFATLDKAAYRRYLAQRALEREIARSEGGDL